MLNDEVKNEILDSITHRGKIADIPINVNINMDNVLSLSSGSPRLQSTLIRKAKLILSKPVELSELSHLQIRCALCKRVISYPAWYYEVKYAVNHFHYFICFDSSSPSKPSTRCYRRD